MKQNLRRAGVFLLGAGAVGLITAWLLRDQAMRHRLNLFSPSAFQRYSALHHLSGEPATVDAVTLLRDFAAWEPQPLLRTRAASILARMEEQLRQGASSA